MMLDRRSVSRLLVGVAILLTVLVSLEIALQYQINYSVPWVPPSESGLSELSWIREHFGFDNASVIISVRDRSSYLWSLAYNGGLVYFGNLLFLLTNQTDYSLLNNNDVPTRSAYIGSLQRLWIYGALNRDSLSRFTILVPSDLYQPNPLERQVLSPVGGGILAVKPLPYSKLNDLFQAWNLARTSGDILGASMPYLSTRPLMDCSMYGRWASHSQSTKVSVRPGFKVSPCSVNVNTELDLGATVYAQFLSNSSWNLQNETYLGFYFSGTANATAPYSFIVLLSSDTGFGSYYSAIVDGTDLWDGNIHGILLPISDFVSHNNPSLGSIASLDLGVYSEKGGGFHYSVEYVVVAIDR